jgi:hypothetical protein
MKFVGPEGLSLKPMNGLSAVFPCDRGRPLGPGVGVLPPRSGEPTRDLQAQGEMTETYCCC